MALLCPEEPSPVKQKTALPEKSDGNKVCNVTGNIPKVVQDNKMESTSETDLCDESDSFWEELKAFQASKQGQVSLIHSNACLLIFFCLSQCLANCRVVLKACVCRKMQPLYFNCLEAPFCGLSKEALQKKIVRDYCKRSGMSAVR
jgi:hypothetical protein